MAFYTIRRSKIGEYPLNTKPTNIFFSQSPTLWTSSLFCIVLVACGRTLNGRAAKTSVNVHVILSYCCYGTIWTCRPYHLLVCRIFTVFFSIIYISIQFCHISGLNGLQNLQSEAYHEAYLVCTACLYILTCSPGSSVLL